LTPRTLPAGADEAGGPPFKVLRGLGQPPGRTPSPIRCFLVKIASRCNLACDYCYVYEHADQSWSGRPKLMAELTRRQLAARIGEYAQSLDLDRVSVVFHGGEPLLAGAATITECCEWIREAAPSRTRIDFSLQTNGLLLDDATLAALGRADVGVSISIDGPSEAHDRHRLTATGRSSFAETLAALERLKCHPDIFAGAIAVIDPAVPPEILLEFFAEHRPPRVDFLLPDAHHLRPPPGRDADPDLYVRWLLEAFDLWFDRYADLSVRSFEAVLDGLVGLPSTTDAFGLGDVSLLSVETDGSYHDLDVLKITREGATAIGGGVAEMPVADAAHSHVIQAHRELLSFDGLAESCRECPEVAICGGGSVPHRFAADGFAHPTVYCREMLALIGHARARVTERLQRDIASSRPKPVAGGEVDLASFDVAENASGALETLIDDWCLDAREALSGALAHAARLGEAAAAKQLLALEPDRLGELAIQPSVVAWSAVMSEDARGRRVRALGGAMLEPDAGYVRFLLSRADEMIATGLRVHVDDPWLRRQFQDARLAFEDAEAEAAKPITLQALRLVEAWRPELLAEMNRLSRDIIFIHDLTADPEKYVSFSDDSTPGALYCSIRGHGGLISPADLADSLIHEHRHQKLYLLGRSVPLVSRDYPLVSSPWREDPRPPSGLLHAVFVFVELLGFWRHLAGSGGTLRQRAKGEVMVIEERLNDGVLILREVDLTREGRTLVSHLESRLLS
jgi:uncharacterized protein